MKVTIKKKYYISAYLQNKRKVSYILINFESRRLSLNFIRVSKSLQIYPNLEKALGFFFFFFLREKSLVKISFFPQKKKSKKFTVFQYIIQGGCPFPYIRLSCLALWIQGFAGPCFLDKLTRGISLGKIFAIIQMCTWQFSHGLFLPREIPHPFLRKQSLIFRQVTRVFGGLCNP